MSECARARRSMRTHAKVVVCARTQRYARKKVKMTTQEKETAAISKLTDSTDIDAV